jgi:hypothetical protein
MTDDGMNRLARELRHWAQRPTRLSPRAARTRVLADLPGSRRRPAWWLVTAGATLAAGALALVLVIGRRQEPIAVTPPTPAATAAQRTIVHQLSSGTKLYIVMRPATAADEC